MTTIILVILSVVFFVIGVALIFRGMASSPDSDEVIDQQEYEQVRSQLDLVQKEEVGLKLQLDSMTMELQDAKALADKTESFKKDVDSLRENDRQRQAMIAQLEENLNFLSRKADQQAKKALVAIEALSSKNKILQAEVQEQLSQSAQVSQEDVDVLKSEKQLLEQQLNGNVQKISELEKTLKGVQEKSETELQEAHQVIQNLEKQNTVFQSGIQEITQKILFVETEFIRVQKEKEQQLENAKQLIDKLRREQHDLEQQGASAEDVSALESEINRIKAESEGRLTEAHQNVGRLQEEINRMQREIQENQHQREELKKQIEESRHTLLNVNDAAITSKIEEQKAQLIQENDDKEKELIELRENNQFLRQKERLLSQELLRSQTQALGLEKICQEFKKQIERG